ncbi:MAG: DUF2474 domain-containing protein [Enterobacteriaceae bacterium]
MPVPCWLRLSASGCGVRQQHNRHTLPFVLTLGLIFLGFSGLGISIWHTSFRRPLRSGKRRLRRKVRALCYWRTADYPDNPRVHLLELLRFAAKFNMVRGIIDATTIWKRLMWLVILWGGSVLALAAVGMFFVSR